MPRMDNSDPYVLGVVNSFREDREEPPIVFNEDDPGDTPPIDICYADWDELFEFEGGDVAAPTYGEWFDYYCAICGDLLTEDDI